MNPPHGSRPYPPYHPGTTNEAIETPRDAAVESVVPVLPMGIGAPGPAPSDTDARLVRRMKAGDEDALAEFYDRWFPVVNCLATRILKSAPDVEDVVEETFWQAWRQADRFDQERGSVQTWLLTMARSRALDRLRATRRRREESIEEFTTIDTSDALSSPTDPSLAVEHAERKQLVLAALADLPREQRDVLELGYFAGLTQTEIAARTRLPLGTVKTRMRLAVIKLRGRLELLREESR